MIFLSTGTQLPFERLVRAVDESTLPDKYDIFGQISNSSYVPDRYTSVPYLDPDAYNQKLNQADLVISHAGIGSIIKTLGRGVPIVVLARKHSLGEHRNNHQISTIQNIRIQGLYATTDETELESLVIKALEEKKSIEISSAADDQLLEYLSEEFSK